MDQENISFRLATAADVPALTALKHRAYVGYVAMTGIEPLPMVADYGRLIAAAIVWLMDHDHNSPLKKALLTGFHSTAKHNATKAVSSSETMRTI